ncbi:MAG TPA: ornithine cyclodeaminase family protein [Pyrinomonadaceae bacterium]|nr:ornithine cyclodeaminase family protein [Pyrinomonadaceae bacterium]
MKSQGTLLLSRSEVADLLSIEECIAAVEQVFKLYGEGKTQPPGILGVHAQDGGFHIKAGLLELDRSFFAAKINANFPQNAKRFGLALIQGAIFLADAQNGYPLAIMDSMEITVRRTGAATAVAAKYLARPDSKSVLICGCGNQGRVSIQALSKIFSLEHVFAFDIDSAAAQRFASHLSDELKIAVETTNDLGEAMKGTDICVTCTPSTQFFLKQEYVQPGTFIAAVGADSETKQELEPALLAKNKTVVDIVDQCASIGELHHAIASDLMTKQHVHAELGDVIAGMKPGRTSSNELIIFDSTGMALQDVITAAAVYKKAVDKGIGRIVDLAQ